MTDWLERTQLLVGEENLKKLQNARILVVGLGGVGSFAAEFLVRCGIGNLIIVDGDVVDVTNINRQLPAVHSSIGQPKVEWMRQRLLDINPDLNLTTFQQFIEPVEAPNFVTPDLDIVLDCIDSISPKISLLVACRRNKVKCISSMGAGGKMQADKVKVTDIRKVVNCKMGKVIKKKLRQNGIDKGIRAVYSNEQQIPESVQLTNGLNYKRSFYGTIGYMPALFGLRAAEEAVRILLNMKTS